MNIIFDMDGVILDSETVYLDGYLYAGRTLGLPEKEIREAVNKCTGCTEEVEKQVMEEMFGARPGFRFEDVFRLSRAYFAEIIRNGQIDLKPGARELLIFLREKGIPAGLASSSPMEAIEEELGKGHDLLGYFNAIVSGDMVTHSKPDPEIFLQCAGKLMIPPEDYKETYVIEDSYNGIRAAAAAGMQPVMIPDRLPPTREMKEKAAWIFSSLYELKNFLEGETENRPLSPPLSPLSP